MVASLTGTWCAVLCEIKSSSVPICWSKQYNKMKWGMKQTKADFGDYQHSRFILLISSFRLICSLFGVHSKTRSADHSCQFIWACVNTAITLCYGTNEPSRARSKRVISARLQSLPGAICLQCEHTLLMNRYDHHVII